MIQSNRISTTKEFVVDAEISVKDVDAFFADDEFCHATKPLKYHATLINKKKFIALEAEFVLWALRMPGILPAGPGLAAEARRHDLLHERQEEAQL